MVGMQAEHAAGGSTHARDAGSAAAAAQWRVQLPLCKFKHPAHHQGLALGVAKPHVVL